MTPSDSRSQPDDFDSITQLQCVLALLTAVASDAPMKLDPPKYLTVQEAACYCRVAVQTIYNNRRHIERMPGVRKLLFTREALDRWLSTRHRQRTRKKGLDRLE